MKAKIEDNQITIEAEDIGEDYFLESFLRRWDKEIDTIIRFITTDGDIKKLLL